MTRALFVLHTDALRARALDVVRGAPDGARVEIRGPTRTLPQNNRMWAMLTDFSRQIGLNGARYDAEDWKVILLHAFGREMRFLPALDGKGFVPVGFASSDLSIAEMAEFIEFMFAAGAEAGVAWSEPDPARPFAPLPEDAA